ncbi:gliding motility-associated protein GldE [Paenimyroides tangerinum]|uniref:Gliding motility-associated protein GldE n=1 Tax=Paenimyroides tangerinum TaxID=2488728 RepID=A0A3P3WGV4_9FLAO|nr:gliding motility-associated protein GldE [Paenimyroides tangerinum]RRJ93336.1 gliding motility-associated protein GldE [Paenimyroides tangerinum]
MDPEPARLFLENSIYIIPLVIFALLILALIALISSTEVAYFSTSKQKFENLNENYPKQADLYQKLLERPAKLQATLNLSSVIFKILFIFSVIEIKFHYFDLHLTTTFSYLITFIILFIGIVFFGEIFPRMYAYRNVNRFIKSSVKTIYTLDLILFPIAFPLQKISQYIANKFSKNDDSFTVEQLSQALEMTDYSETSEEEQKILEGIASFGLTEVSQVMTPRIDIFALSTNESLSEVLPKIIENGYSRIPVYNDNIDEIAGVLFIKDLIPHLNKKFFNWKTLLREAYFIPENKKLDDLLKDFQTQKNHLAVVVDEFGETAGIISLEDILEEIVGEITDEFDEDEKMFTKIDSENYLFDGKISMKDFYRIVPVDEDEFESERKEAESLAGFILEQTEIFPKVNDVISFANCNFTIIQVNKRRLQQIKVTIQTNETNN